MEKIIADKILFIKLGKGGEFEEECTKNGYLKLDYNEIFDDDCRNLRWQEVVNFYTERGHSLNVATSHKNQIKKFYTEPESTLWITFYANKLWWCFTDKEVRLLPDKTKIRYTKNGWHDKDIKGNVLLCDKISGRLTRVTGFRGAICAVNEKEYCLTKINSEVAKEVQDVMNLKFQLKQKVSSLIKKLQWKDFELLVDLIFRQSGWRRESELGHTRKSIDIELYSSIAEERAIVEIKSESNLKQFNEYKERFLEMNQYNKYFYIVHSPLDDLRKYYAKDDDVNIYLYFDDKISELVINYGLVDWLVDRLS